MWGDEFYRDLILEAIHADAAEDFERWKLVYLELRDLNNLTDNALTFLVTNPDKKMNLPKGKTLLQFIKSGARSNYGTFDEDEAARLFG